MPAIAVVSGRKRVDGSFCSALPALRREGSTYDDSSRSREHAVRCLGGHWEVALE